MVEAVEMISVQSLLYERISSHSFKGNAVRNRQMLWEELYLGSIRTNCIPGTTRNIAKKVTWIPICKKE